MTANGFPGLSPRALLVAALLAGTALGAVALSWDKNVPDDEEEPEEEEERPPMFV